MYLIIISINYKVLITLINPSSSPSSSSSSSSFCVCVCGEGCLLKWTYCLVLDVCKVTNITSSIYRLYLYINYPCYILP